MKSRLPFLKKIGRIGRQKKRARMRRKKNLRLKNGCGIIKSKNYDQFAILQKNINCEIGKGGKGIFTPFLYS